MAQEELGPSHPLYLPMEQIRKAADRSAALTRQLLSFARKQITNPKVLDLNKTMEGMLKMLQRLIGEDIDMVWSPMADLWLVEIDPSQLDQILANLCVNARDAIFAPGGRLTVATQNITIDAETSSAHHEVVAGEYVALTVSDNGCGMGQETLANLFEPFFTTKEMGKGTGLGLAMVYGIVKQNRGFINVVSEPGKGTTFIIHLPRHHGSEKNASAVTPANAVCTGCETILLVEDEAAILKMASLMLHRKGYRVLAAATPGEALALAHQHCAVIDLLVTDVIMPEINGRDLMQQLTTIIPDLKTLYLSGYPADVISCHGVMEQGVDFLQKPFSMQELTSKVRGILDQ